MNTRITLAVSLLSLLASSSALAEQQPASRPNTVDARIDLNDPRPLAAAAVELAQRHNLRITFEDAPCDFAADQADVTAQVRRDLGDFPAGAAPRVLIPRGGQITLDYTVDADLDRPANPVAVVNDALRANEDAGNPGRYRAFQSDRAVHIIPAAARAANGALSTVRPALDAYIQVPAAPCNGLQRLEAILGAVSDASGQTVIVGTIPVSLLSRLSGQFPAVGANSREALLDLFDATGATLSWQMFYDPTMKCYVLNVYAIETN